MSTQIQNFYEATITRNWTATTGDFNVSVAPNISEGIIVISPSSRTLREIVRFTATGTNAYGSYVRISNIAHRGLGGTTAQAHSIGEKVRMNITAEHWTEMQNDINSIIAAGLPAGAEGDVMYHNGVNWVAKEEEKTNFPSSTVLDSTTTTDWANLDLSSIVGVKERIVLLKIYNLNIALSFFTRPNGDTSDYSFVNPNGYSAGVFATRTSANAGSATAILCKTDSNGIIQMKSSGAGYTIKIDVLAYW